MNTKKRNALKQASCFLDRAINLITSVTDAEQDALDNIPENLQYSARAEKMEDAISLLDDAVESIEEAKEKIESASAR